MEARKILLAGVGGQGLVLATEIIANAANYSGIDVKTNDVIGLSQRGGKVWGSVKMGEKVHSPNINPWEADLLIAFEKLEAKRFRKYLHKENSAVVINSYEMAPTLVQQEVEEYDPDVIQKVKEYASEVIEIDATETAASFGNSKAANIILLGVAARYMEGIAEEAWVEAITNAVPENALEVNLKAFKAMLHNEV